MHPDGCLYPVYVQQPRKNKLFLRPALAFLNAEENFLLGGLNSRFQPSHVRWFWNGKVKTKSSKLLTICTKHLLHITNTNSKHKQIHENSLMRLRSKHSNLIDHIITRLCDLPNVLITRTMRKDICYTDTFRLKPLPNYEGRKKTKCRSRSSQPTRPISRSRDLKITCWVR